MAEKSIVSNSKLTAIGDAIRSKNESTNKYTLDEMVTAIKAIKTGDFSDDYIQHSEIPTYVKDSVLNIVNQVKAIQDNANTFTFIVGSDAHQWYNENVTNGNLHAGMAMKALAYALNLDCAMYLGDYTTGSATTTIEEGLEHIGIINQDIDEAFKGLPQLRTTGNHDPLTYSYSQNNDYLSEEELFPLIGAYCQGATYGSNTAGYCYRDFASKKIRVICLNTADITAATSGSAEAVSEAQRIWFAETLLSAGNLGSDWGIIVVSHHPLDWGGILIMSNIVQAYVTGSSITVTSGHSYNFNGHNSAHFICQFHGHVHCYKMDKLHYTTSGTEYDAYRMAIPNMCFNRNNEYGTTPSYYGIVFGETTTYNKTANSAEDTAFCVVCIDLDAEKIYAFHYGAGYDRTLEYGAATTYSVTNMLTHVSTSNQSASVSEGDSYTAAISATAPYSVGTITVTMGGVDITASAVSGSTITIAEVTGDITVAASGVLGNLINYFGYTDDQRISKSDGDYRTKSGCTTIEYIKLSEFANNDTVTFRITGAQFIHKSSPWDDNSYVFYNESKNLTVGGYSTGTETYGNITVITTATSDTDMTITITGLKAVYLTSNYSYLRLCGVGSGANIDIRLVEP